MKRFALLLLLPLLLLAACEKHYNYHYRRVVIVDTPQGEVRGSAVGAIEFRYNSGVTLPDSPRGHTQVTGEATVVDLGNGRYLFVLLGHDLGQLIAAHSEALDLEKGSGNSRIRRIYGALKQQTTPRPLPPKNYPLLVTFGDLSDPASVMRVDPADLAATFGAGYALREITLEVTDDAVTEGVVEGVLGWLSDGHTLKDMWNSLSWQQHDLLTSTNWRKGN